MTEKNEKKPDATVPAGSAIAGSEIFGEVNDDTDTLGDALDNERNVNARSMAELARDAATASGASAEEAEEEDEEEAGEEAEDEQEAGTIDEMDDEALGRYVRQVARSQPVEFVKALIEQLPPEQRAQLGLKEEGRGPAARDGAILDEPLAPPGDDDESAAKWEAKVTEALNRVNALPERLEQRVVDTAGRLAVYVDSAAAAAAVARAMINAVAESVGIELPEVDINRVARLAQNGATWEQAVERVVGKALKRAVRAAKQKRAERPSTPAGGGIGIPEIGEHDTLADIAARLAGKR